MLFISFQICRLPTLGTRGFFSRVTRRCRRVSSRPQADMSSAEGRRNDLTNDFQRFLNCWNALEISVGTFMLIQTFGVAIQLYLHPSISTALMRPRRPNQYCLQLYICICIWLNWIYVNMAAVNVYRSSAKYVLGTNTLTLPTQENGWLSAPSTDLCNYHDNYSQQNPDSAGLGQSNNKVLASQSLQ